MNILVRKIIKDSTNLDYNSVLASEPNLDAYHQTRIFVTWIFSSHKILCYDSDITNSMGWSKYIFRYIWLINFDIFRKELE